MTYKFMEAAVQYHKVLQKVPQIIAYQQIRKNQKVAVTQKPVKKVKNLKVAKSKSRKMLTKILIHSQLLKIPQRRLSQNE